MDKKHFGSMRDIDSRSLTEELVLRMGDWLHDPEPQFDELFEKQDRYHAEAVYAMLKNVLRRKTSE